MLSPSCSIRVFYHRNHTSPHTDHTREYVPVLWFNEKTEPKELGLRKGFYDLGATVAGIFDVEEFVKGKGF
jgi:phosphopentomutase